MGTMRALAGRVLRTDSFESLLRQVAQTPEARPPAEPPAWKLEPGQHISDRWVLERPLGEGAFAEVWLATDVVSGEPAALKLLFTGKNKSAVTVRAFRHEALSMAWLGHPGIVAVHGEGQDAATQRMWFAMEYVDGQSMRKLELDAVLGVYEDTLAALAYAHARGVIHRDLKPANLMAVSEGPTRAKVFDFGVAHTIERAEGVDEDAAIPSRGRMIGTPAYVSPEQAAGDSACVGPASDLYTIGVMLFETLAGALPFRGNTPSVLSQHVVAERPALVVRPAMSSTADAELAALVGDLIQARYEDRPVFAANVRRRVAHIRSKLRPTQRIDLGAVPRSAPTAPVTTPLRTPETDPPVGPYREDERAALSDREIRFLRDAPPAGRRAERAELMQALQRVTHSHKSETVTLLGPEGVGKTRLARWFAEEAHEEARAHTLRAHLDERGDLVAAMHGAFYRHLRSPQLEDAQVRKRLGSSLGMIGGDADQMTGFLLERQSLELDPDHRADVVSRWAGPWLEALAGVRRGAPVPVLLWLDGGAPDDPGIHRWLGSIRRRSTDVVCVWSPDGPAPASVGGGAVLELGPLSDAAMRREAGRLVPGLATAAIDLAVGRTAGNPRWLREVLGTWLRSEVLVASPEGWTVPSETVDVAPAELQDALREHVAEFVRRYDDPDRVRDALESLSIMGGDFTAAQLDRLARPPLAEDLRREGWLEVTGMGRAERLSLAPVQLRSLLQESALARGVRDALAARCVEERLRGALTATRGADWESAIVDLRVVDILLSEHAVPDADRVRVQALDMMATVRFRQREPVRLRDVAAALADLGTSPSGRLATALAALWTGCATLLEDQRESSRQIWQVALDGIPPAYARIQLLQRLGERALTAGEDGAGALLQEAYDLAVAGDVADWGCGATVQASRLAALRGDLVRALAEWHLRNGDPPVAAALLRRVLRLYLDERDFHGQAATYIQLTRVLRQEAQRTGAAEDRAQVLRHLHEAELLLADLDDRRGQALLSWEAATFAAVEGNAGSAQELYEHAAKRFTAAGDREGPSLCFNAMGELARSAGQLAEAQRHYQRFLEAARQRDHGLAVSLANLNLGLCALGLGAASEAVDRLLEATAGLGPGAGAWAVTSRVALAEAWALTGDYGSAAAALNEAVSLQTPLDDDGRASLDRLVALATSVGQEPILVAAARLKS